ncbi:MAG: ABC transporter ATP-binding protein, partial [Candidatus Heimdallarchaeota archaeon]|nr:ABC transporter ATP-binding protein [Candidatus Heimdallarchaeota archaeon]MCK5144700.1 ABC transporter ATP-binding protein [Candidatus Heimdallarchaeota archaeon]
MVKVKINNLSMKYEKKLIIDDFELEIIDGELLVLLGASGCGKTSLLKIIAGIIEPEEGTIIFDEKDITNYTPQKRKVGYVPQAQVLFPHMKVKQNISFGLEANKLSKDEIKERITWIAEITQIQDLLDRFPSEISGGQKQRV